MSSPFEPAVPREPMPPASPYGVLQIERRPWGPALMTVAPLVKVSQKLIDESPYMVVDDDVQLTITCSNGVAVYNLGDVVEVVKNEKSEVVDTFREARLVTLA